MKKRKKLALTSMVFIFLSLMGMVIFWLEAKVFGTSNQNIIVHGIKAGAISTIALYIIQQIKLKDE